MKSPAEARPPEELISAYLGGSLAPEEEARLNDWLASSPEHLNQFIRQLELHSAIRDVYAQSETPALAPGGARKSPPSRGIVPRIVAPGSRWRRRLALAAAALILVVLGIVASTSRKGREIAPDGSSQVKSGQPPLLRPGSEDAPGKAREENVRLEKERIALQERLAALEREKKGAAERSRLEEARRPELPQQESSNPERRPTEDRPKVAVDAPRPPQEPGRPEEPKGPAAAPSAAGQTVATVGTLSWVQGEVYFIEGEKRTRAKEGDRLPEGRGLETIGPLGGAELTFADLSRIELLERTSIREISSREAGPGKRVHVVQGTVDAKVVKQPAEQPMVFITPYGEAKVLGTVLRIHVDADPREGTRVDVQEGKVELKNLAGESAEISSAYSAVAAAGVRIAPRRAGLQDARKKGAAAVDPKVDRAIQRGIAYLKTPGTKIEERDEELVLWTFIHAGVPESDPDFQRMLKGVLQRDLTRTYNVSLLAMILEELDRVKYQARIYQCAQFLIDNQCANGQWSYGTPTLLKELPEEKGKKSVATPSSPPARKSESGLRVKPKVTRTVPIMRTRDGPGMGDNSNSQYAALGLRACHDAGIELPREEVERAKKWWIESLVLDGGQDPKTKVASGEGPAAGGWGYGAGKTPFGSMTAGAVGSVVIYQYLLGQPWLREQGVLSGLRWLTEHFSVSNNANVDRAGYPADSNYSYYLYALERVGMLYGTETLGKHEWYSEGVQVILKAQRADGSWESSTWDARRPVWDTCFTILFLRRATRPIDVASEDRFMPRK